MWEDLYLILLQSLFQFECDRDFKREAIIEAIKGNQNYHPNRDDCLKFLHYTFSGDDRLLNNTIVTRNELINFVNTK